MQFLVNRDRKLNIPSTLKYILHKFKRLMHTSKRSDIFKIFFRRAHFLLNIFKVTKDRLQNTPSQIKFGLYKQVTYRSTCHPSIKIAFFHNWNNIFFWNECIDSNMSFKHYLLHQSFTECRTTCKQLKMAFHERWSRGARFVCTNKSEIYRI